MPFLSRRFRVRYSSPHLRFPPQRPWRLTLRWSLVTLRPRGLQRAESLHPPAINAQSQRRVGSSAAVSASRVWAVTAAPPSEHPALACPLVGWSPLSCPPTPHDPAPAAQTHKPGQTNHSRAFPLTGHRDWYRGWTCDWAEANENQL